MRPAPADPDRAHGARARRARRFLLFALSGGGRVVGSDEVTMLELSRALLRGRVAVPEGATLQGPDGRLYTKNAAGQAVLALPLVALAESGAAALRLDPARRDLAVRFGVSFFDALVTALLLGAPLRRRARARRGGGAALAAAALLGFTTPTWIYAKSFMAEPLQALGLLLALVGAALRAGGAAGAPPAPRARRRARGAARGLGQAHHAAAGAGLPGADDRRAAGARGSRPALGLALALAGHAAYGVARFGTPFETGYGAQASAAAFTTPALVGLYGLLLSSGKGVAWFAPALWLAPRGWRAATRRAGRAPRALERADAGRAARLGRAGAVGGGAGALLPLPALGGRRLVRAALPGAAAAARGSCSWPSRCTAPRARCGAARVALGLAGLLVTLGGVGIYFGAQMREAGDYPYTLPLEDPRFMSDSHFNPRFSPIAGHWGMLVRNAGEHLRGERPRLTGLGAPDARLGLGAADQAALLHGLDFWWAYALYAGTPAAPGAGRGAARSRR